MNSSIPWTEKFRPTKLDDVISNAGVIDTLKKYVDKKFIPHLLLYGPAGVGKTSTAKACAQHLYGENYDFMVMEINASEERGIEVIRNKVRDFIMSKSMFFGMRDDIFKLVIFDEADSMTEDAQSMLRRLIEDNTFNARFCLICNKIKNIDPALQSRCTCFRFSPLNDKDITIKLKHIAKVNNLKLTDDGIETIIKIGRGDMRSIINILQATSMAHSKINSNAVSECLGYPKTEQMEYLTSSLIFDNYTKSLKHINGIRKKFGYSLNKLLTEVHATITQMFMNDELNEEYVLNLFLMLKDLEINLSSCPNETVQTAGLIAMFIKCKKYLK